MSFESLSFTHIYKELNAEADALSKMALALQPGIIVVEEHSMGQVSEHFLLN